MAAWLASLPVCFSLAWPMQVKGLVWHGDGAGGLQRLELELQQLGAQLQQQRRQHEEEIMQLQALGPQRMQGQSFGPPQLQAQAFGPPQPNQQVPPSPQTELRPQSFARQPPPAIPQGGIPFLRQGIELAGVGGAAPRPTQASYTQAAWPDSAFPAGVAMQPNAGIWRPALLQQGEGTWQAPPQMQHAFATPSFPGTATDPAAPAQQGKWTAAAQKVDNFVDKLRPGSPKVEWLPMPLLYFAILWASIIICATVFFVLRHGVPYLRSFSDQLLNEEKLMTSAVDDPVNSGSVGSSKRSEPRKSRAGQGVHGAAVKPPGPAADPKRVHNEGAAARRMETERDRDNEDDYGQEVEEAWIRVPPPSQPPPPPPPREAVGAEVREAKAVDKKYEVDCGSSFCSSSASTDVPPPVPARSDEANELKRALAKRRAKVDCRGASFTSSAAEPKADASFKDRIIRPDFVDETDDDQP